MTAKDNFTLLLDKPKEFGVNPEKGFLPAADPLQTLPRDFAAWEQVAGELPKLLVSGRIRSILKELPLLDVLPLQGEAEYERAMLLLSFLGHAYVWGERKPAHYLPECISVPWWVVSHFLGRPPVLSYASYALWNWKRFDVHGLIALGNIALLQNFLGGIDEEWFILVHVNIEMEAAKALAAIPSALDAASSGDAQLLVESLMDIADSIENMNQVLSKMPEHCDPYIYYNRVRPYIHGWKDQLSIPHGVIYQGVEEFGGKPQKFRGETGAQSSIIPSLDSTLGILHKEGPLLHFLNEMRDYMPPKHREFIEAVEGQGSVRSIVLKNQDKNSALRDVYNQCIEGIQNFRSTHLGYARKYIDQQKEGDSSNPNKVGTGGTPFMAYLKKHKEETNGHSVKVTSRGDGNGV